MPGYFDSVKNKRADPTPGTHHHLAAVPPGEATSYAAGALRREAAIVTAAPEGQRNATLNKAWFNMGRHVGAGNINPATVRDTLADAGRACGLPQHEIDTILRDGITSGLTNGAAHPRHPPPLDPIPTVTTLPDTGPTTEADEDGFDVAGMVRDKFPLLDWHQLWDSEDEEDEWIAEPVIPARRLVALFSAPKVGKSLLMLELAVNIARGTEALGTKLDKPRRVLYVDFENDPRGDIRTRLQSMGAKPGELDNLCYLSYPTLAKLDTFTGAAELMAIVTEYQCELVVIDTISRAVAGEENENDTWLSFYRNTGLALKQAGVACIRLDHTGKDHDKGMRGGSAKYGDVDAVWKLSKVTDDVYRLDCTDHRMRLTETEIVLTRHQHPLRHVVAAEGRMAATDAKVAEIVAALDSISLPDDTGRETARKALKAQGAARASNFHLDKAVKERKQRLGYSTIEESI